MEPNVYSTLDVDPLPVEQRDDGGIVDRVGIGDSIETALAKPQPKGEEE